MNKNIYLIYGTNDYLIKEEVKKIVKNTDPINIVKYNLNNTTIEEVLEDALTISLFSENKTIIVEKSNIFTTFKSEIEHNIKKLELYLSNQNPNTVLIFVVNSDKIDSRKKVCKLIKDKGILIHVTQPNNLVPYVQKKLNGYEISIQNINFLINRTGTNLGIINNEVKKLKIYKKNNFKISKDDILNVVSKNLEPDIYYFIDCIIKRNLDEAFVIYNELITLNKEPILIISLLANNFRLMYQSKQLIQKGYTLNDIASSLESHIYPVKLAIEKGRMYSDKILLNCLEKLADLDFQIKSGQIDKNIGLELFILSM